MKVRIGQVKAAALGLCWTLSCAYQAMGAPYALSVAHNTNEVVIAWPVQYMGSQLQQTLNLASPWTDVPATVATNQVSFPALSASRFFRLCAPSIPTLGLVARYDFNGNANDSVGGHHGAIHGATPTSNRFTNGSSAYSFNGTNAYIEIPDHSVFSISTTRKFSMSVWMRPGTTTFPEVEGGPGATNYVYWMGKGVPDQHEWACRMYNLHNSENRPNWISFYVFNLGGDLGAGSRVEDPVTPLVWLHFVATVDVAANTIKWYENGALRDTDTLSGFSITPENGTAPVRLGTRNRDSYFKGSIDNLLFYNRVLSAFEVIQLYQDRTP
jgi:hypothetical protein